MRNLKNLLRWLYDWLFKRLSQLLTLRYFLILALSSLSLSWRLLGGQTTGSHCGRPFTEQNDIRFVTLYFNCTWPILSCFVCSGFVIIPHLFYLLWRSKTELTTLVFNRKFMFLLLFKLQFICRVWPVLLSFGFKLISLAWVFSFDSWDHDRPILLLSRSNFIAYTLDFIIIIPLFAKITAFVIVCLVLKVLPFCRGFLNSLPGITNFFHYL